MIVCSTEYSTNNFVLLYPCGNNIVLLHVMAMSTIYTHHSTALDVETAMTTLIKDLPRSRLKDAGTVA